MRVHTIPGRMWAIRAFGWQLDYRRDGWLPFSIRYGHRRWHVLPLGRMGCVTLGRVAGPFYDRHTKESA